MTSDSKDAVTKRQLFVREMAKHGNRVDASRRAGYSRPSTDGTRLLKLPAIRDAIEDERRQLKSERPVNAAYFIEELLAIASDCKAEKPHVAVTALIGAAKISGVMINKVETKEVSAPRESVPDHVSPLGAKLESLSPDKRRDVLRVLFDVQHEASIRDAHWIDGASDSAAAWAALPADLRERVELAVIAAERADAARRGSVHRIPPKG